MNKKIPVVILSVILFVTLSQMVLAAPSYWPLVPCGTSVNPTPCNQCDLFKLLKNIIDFVLIGLMPPAAAILFVWGGFLILMGGANPGWITKGKTIFWNTAIGVAIISASWLITNTIIKSVANENIVNPNTPWYQFECKATTTTSSGENGTLPGNQLPPGGGTLPGGGTSLQRFGCFNNSCIADPSGNYLEGACGDSCDLLSSNPSTDVGALPGGSTGIVRYGCVNNACVKNTNGDFVESTCGNTCGSLPSRPTTGNTSTLPGGTGLVWYGCLNNACVKNTQGDYPESSCNNACSLLSSNPSTGTGTLPGGGTGIQRYSCSENGACVKNSNGKYLDSSCDNACSVLPSTIVVISNVASSNVTANGATITWTTNVPATSIIYYGVSAQSEVVGDDQNLVTKHTVVMTNSLQSPIFPNTTYQFSVESVATDGHRANSSTYKFTTTSGGAVCKFTGVNLCQAASSGGCSNSLCGQYVSAINQYSGGAASANLLKAIMVNESSCDYRKTSFSGTSFGLMQLSPGTVTAAYKTRCGIPANTQINQTWLTSQANANLSICIAAEYLRALSQSACGNDPRQIAANYNGGNACATSADCAGEKSCDGSQVRRWECLYDDNAHQTCNTGFDETRGYVPKVLYCYNNPGF